MNHMSVKIKPIALISIAVLSLFLPLLFSRYFLHLTIFMMITAIAVLGLGILGASGQISSAQGAFYGIGAYTCALLCTRLGCSYWVALIAVILIACVVGVLVGLPAIKVSGLYLVMTTLGINEIIYIIMMNSVSFTGGPQGVSQIPPIRFLFFSLDTMKKFYYLAFAMLVIFTFLSNRILKSRLGLFFISIKSSDIASRMNGVNVLKTKLVAFVISAVYGGIAGSLYASYIGYIHPDNFKTDVSVLFLTMSIFGGQRSVLGMICATIILTFATEYFRFIGDYRMIAYGLVLVLGMMFMPEGIGSKIKDFQHRRLVKRGAV